MAYYDAFIAAWNAGGIPANTTGTSITGGMTAAQKLAAVNGWTIAGPTNVTLVPTHKIFNAIVAADFTSLSASDKARLDRIFSLGAVDASPGTNVRAEIASVLAGKTTSLANLQALNDTFKTTIPWWQSASYPRAFDTGDVTAAGLS